MISSLNQPISQASNQQPWQAAGCRSGCMKLGKNNALPYTLNPPGNPPHLPTLSSFPT
jgi:hypothetical protein